MKKAQFTVKALLSLIMVVVIAASMSIFSFAATTLPGNVTNANLSYGEIVPTDAKLVSQKQSYTFYGDSAELYFMQISKGKPNAHFCIEIFTDKNYDTQIQSYSSPYSISSGNKALKLTWNFKNLGSGAYYGRCYSYVETDDVKTIDTKSIKTFTINIDRLSKREVKLASLANTASGPKITWESVPTAKTYNIYRRAAGEKSWTYLYTERNGGTSYTDKTAASGKYYAYTVKCYDGKYVSLYNTKGLNIFYLSMPQISVNGSGTAGSATVKWNKVPGAAGYNVYRKGGSLSNYAWTCVAKIQNGNTVSYVDKTATSTDWKYTYTVKAYYGNYVSSYKSDGVDFNYIAAPTLSRASSDETGMKIEWKANNSNITRYYVYRKNGTSWKYLGATTNKYFIDTTAVSNTTYTYTVKATSTTNDGAYNGTGITAKFLKAPALQKLTFDSSYKAVVKWEKVAGASGYKVYRKIADAKSWTLIATIKNGSTTTYNDGCSKASGVKYTYTVRAFDSKNLHSYFVTNGTSGICLAKPYYSLEQIFTAENTTAVQVSWGAINGATKYNVYRRVPGGTWAYLDLGITDTTYIDSTAEIGITYEYAVRALNDAGDMSAFYTKAITPVIRPEIDSVTVSEDGAKIIWTALENADYYTVYRQAEIADGWEILATVTEAEYLDTSDEAKKQHFYYMVSATFDETESALSEKDGNFVQASISAEFVPGTENTKPAISVKIDYEADAVAGVYRSINDGAPILKEDDTSFDDIEIIEGAQHTYTLLVTKPGKLETQVSVTVKYPHPPLAKALITSCVGNYNEGDPFIVLTWEEVEFADEYVVYRSANDGEWIEVGTVIAEPEAPETSEPSTEPTEPEAPETNEPSTEPTEPEAPETSEPSTEPEITETEETENAELYGEGNEPTTEEETTEEPTTEPETTVPEEEPTEPAEPKKEFSFKDEGVSSEIEYKYYVKAVATKSERDASESEAASCFIKTLLNKLTGIKFEAEKTEEPLKVAVTVTWDEVMYAEKYEIRRKLGDSEELIAIIPADAELSFTDIVRINREITYVITASAEDRGQVSNSDKFCWTEVPPVPSDEECIAIHDDMSYIKNGFIFAGQHTFDDFTVIGDSVGEYVLEAPHPEEGFLGTGTIIEISLDGYKLKSYTLIVKGDIDVDGIVDTLDYLKLNQIVSGQYTPTDIEKLAADINNDGVIDDTDLEAMFEII